MLAVSSVLDLGTGTGETLTAVLRRHRGAAAIGIDKNEAMLGRSPHRLEGFPVELRVAELTEPLPAGPFDLVVSALAIHHVDGPGKAALFARVAGCCGPAGASCSATWWSRLTPPTPSLPSPPTMTGPPRWPTSCGGWPTPGWTSPRLWSERDLVVVRADRRL